MTTSSLYIPLGHLAQAQPRLHTHTHSQAQSRPQRERAPVLTASWARHQDEVREAQSLRYQVFAQEMGARLTPPSGTPAGLDADHFDDFCEHLLIRTSESADAPSRVVGTYRVLTPEGARRAGGLYSETEFYLGSLASLRPKMVELGRSCTDAEFRQGGVILMLWSSLAEFMQRNQMQHMVGCASIGMQDGGHAAASLWTRVRETHLALAAWQVQPRLPLPVEHLECHRIVEMPPLIKGYLRCGAKVLGAPAWDPDFGVADLPILMDMADLPESYRARFTRG